MVVESTWISFPSFGHPVERNQSFTISTTLVTVHCTIFFIQCRIFRSLLILSCCVFISLSLDLTPYSYMFSSKSFFLETWLYHFGLAQWFSDRCWYCRQRVDIKGAMHLLSGVLWWITEMRPGHCFEFLSVLATVGWQEGHWGSKTSVICAQM